jgi:type 1 glutamine amidotransferase
LLLATLAAVALALLAGTTAALFRADDDPYDQSGVPLEKQPTDPKAVKIVLVAGKQSHGPGDHEFFAGCAILMKLLAQTEGVAPVMARDGWPNDPKTFEGAKAVVFYMDGGGGHPVIQKDHPETVAKLLENKVGFVNLHYAVEYPNKVEDRVLTWLGGYYETGVSVNPHWDADFKELPEHPITRGVKPFKIRDEWYYNIHFGKEKITPILKATPPDNTRRTESAKKYPGREETVAWAFTRADGGRSFGFTGGHTHNNWGNENFRRLVVNAILWTANVEVPKDGAKVDLDPAELKKNLDRKKK